MPPHTAVTLAGRKNAVSALHKLGYAHIPNVSAHKSDPEYTWQTIDAKSFTDAELSNGTTNLSRMWRTAEFQECFNASREELVMRYHALVPELRQKIMRMVYYKVANGREWIGQCRDCALNEGPPKCRLQKHFGMGNWHCAFRLMHDLQDVLDYFSRKMEWQRVQRGAIVLRYIDFDYQLIYADYLALLRQCRGRAMRPVIVPPPKSAEEMCFIRDPQQYDASAICSLCSANTVAFMDTQITYVETMCDNIKIRGRDSVKYHLDAFHCWEGEVRTATNLSVHWYSYTRFCIWGCDGVGPQRMGVRTRQEALQSRRGY